jgi:DNA-binding PadR family transcriptional regulator
MGLTLTYQTALVLEAIAAGRHHGFDIMDATDLPSGTVYPILRRLDDEGLVRSKWERDTVARREQRPARRYYELTAAGDARLGDARARYRALETLGPGMARRWKPA